jgi:ferredoxin
MVKTKESWHIEVSSACMGTGQCIAAAPQYFRLVDGHSRPVAENVSADGLVTMAAELCPMGAITVHIRETGNNVAATD